VAVEDRRDGHLLFGIREKGAPLELVPSRAGLCGRRACLSNRCIRMHLAGQLSKARCTER
jgi:hypothetical protein